MLLASLHMLKVCEKGTIIRLLQGTVYGSFV